MNNLRIMAGVTGLVVGGAIIALTCCRFCHKNKEQLEKAAGEAADIKDAVEAATDALAE